jgi:hypothetical protein
VHPNTFFLRFREFGPKRADMSPIDTEVEMSFAALATGLVIVGLFFAMLSGAPKEKEMD